MVSVRFLVLPAAAALAVLASSCGVTADTTAATVGDQVVDVDTIDQLAADEEFLEFGLGLQGAPPVGESTVPGEVARAVLLFEVQRAAWLNELDRWGLELSDQARASGLQRLDEERELAGVESTFSDPVREVFGELFGAQLLLEQRFSTLDPTSETDLRTLYESVPAFWSRTCVQVVEFDASEADAARGAIADGADVDVLAAELQTAQLVADPERACISTGQIAPTLREPIDTAPIGRVSDVVIVDGGQVPVGYVFRVEERQRISFADAGGDLVGIAESLVQSGPAEWVGLQVADAEINPRYGSGVTTGPGGNQVITPPELPAPAPTSVPGLQAPEGLEELLPTSEPAPG